MTRLRPILALFLALTLMLTNSVAAAARVQRVGAMEVVLCSGHGGMQTLWLDGRGEPMAPPHDCPDCLPAILATLPGSAHIPPRPVGIGRPLLLPAAVPAAPAHPPTPAARAPPVLS
ncbi:MAG: hypothetical protein QM656_10940 [Paracoccaceae bacterium]